VSVRFRARTLIAATAAVALSPGAARGQIALVKGERLKVGVAGYVRTLSGVYDAGFVIGEGSETTGFHGAVTRLKWSARVGSTLNIEVHNRVLMSLTSGGGGPVVGLGTSRTPGRAVDLTSRWVEQERLTVLHDVDRLALTLYTGSVDLTVDRQAVSWGTSLLFPVADLFAAFSPFELDTEEKPGVDGVRALAYPGEGLELDVVVLDRGESEHLSAGVRLTRSGRRTESWLGAGKFWREAMVMGGVTLVGDATRLRLEAVLPRDLDRGEFLDPRITLGVDRIGARLTLSAEAHFNGLGATEVDGYAARLVSPELARGETYYLGRRYLGGVAAWTPDEGGRLGLVLSLLANLDDGSASLSPAVRYDLGQSARLGVGGLLSFGEEPRVDPGGLLPILGSEFGSYGRTAFVQLSVYF
jgi:hypothetical protein